MKPEPPTHNWRFAPIEDLDPEPPSRVRRGHRWEFAVGVLLVLGIAGVGAWQWWQGQAKAAAYQAGAHAAAIGDWDSAYAAYRRAEGYADAADRAAAAGQTIARRNTQYQSATAAAQTGNWPAALQAIRQVQQIAPHYENTAQIGQDAQQHVYTAALSDAVVLRPTAAPPGFYIYSPAGWRWLQGSDSQSRVQATCPDGEIIFDAAPGRAAVTPTPPLLRRSCAHVVIVMSSVICWAAGPTAPLIRAAPWPSIHSTIISVPPAAYGAKARWPLRIARCPETSLSTVLLPGPINRSAASRSSSRATRSSLGGPGTDARRAAHAAD